LSQRIWTVLDLLRWTEQRFQKEGLASPRLDAEVLLAETQGVDRVGLYTHFDQPVQAAELVRFRQFIQRRLRREPVAYITGKREFWSLTFEVNPDVLIPRPETEILVAEALKLMPPTSPPGLIRHLLEIGTGSGAIVTALAKEIPSAQFVATDLSSKAIAVARGNALRHGLHERIRFLQGDLFSPLEEEWKFDLLVTNPPYIPQEALPSLAPEIREFEPRTAWDGGKDGLDFIRRLFQGAVKFLQPQGWLLIEIGAGQDEAVWRIAERTQGLKDLAFVPDLAGIQRVFKAQRN
jgi:release factor glutamine methyltransferase